MESEKKDYISNQETTAVYYKKPNQKMIDRYLQIYEKAKENKNIKACYLGLDKQFRIVSRDSYISTLTDPEVMFEYVLYPQYCDGNIEIKAEVFDMMVSFVQSKNAIELYQAFSFLSAEIMMSKFLGEIPFIIFDKELAKIMKKKALEMKKLLISFKDGDFGKYKTSMYDVICDIMKSSNLFCGEK